MFPCYRRRQSKLFGVTSFKNMHESTKNCFGGCRRDFRVSGFCQVLVHRNAPSFCDGMNNRLFHALKATVAGCFLISVRLEHKQEFYQICSPSLAILAYDSLGAGSFDKLIFCLFFHSLPRSMYIMPRSFRK